MNLHSHYTGHIALQESHFSLEKLSDYYIKLSHSKENQLKKKAIKLQKLEKRLREAGTQICHLEGTIKKLRKDKKKLIEYKHKCKLLAQYNDILNELYDKAAFVACLPEAIRHNVLPQYHRPTIVEHK